MDMTHRSWETEGIGVILVVEGEAVEETGRTQNPKNLEKLQSLSALHGVV
jgi:hypothetical protein